ncbi:glycoside hydrolase [Planctomycetales bacterium ZRK34]|nr:glycoside hydrolase [Planctomycetales bacterium ZRK34]
MKRCAMLAVVMAMVALSGEGRAADQAWTGQWIGVSQPSEPNQWICYRKTITLDDKPTAASARIACDSKYWLWVNGELVVFEGQLKRGPTPSDTYYDTVELAPSLQKGANTIAVLVEYFGRPSFSHNSSGQAALVFELSTPGGKIVSDKTWKAKINPAFGTTDPPLDNFRLPEANIRFDTRQAMVGWNGAGYDDAAWPAAVEFGKPPAKPWGKLYARPIALWKDTGLIDYENAAELPAAGRDEEIIAKLPYNLHASPYLKIEAPAGKVIKLHADNWHLYGDRRTAELHRHEYVTRQGVQSWELPGFINGHEIHYQIPPGVKILELKYRETGYNADFVGKFECDDARLNTLWKKAERTLYVTMRDTYYDCPDRERAQWWGDAVNEIGEAFYVFDAERGPMLAKKGMYELANWQRPDKVLYSPVPSSPPPSWEDFKTNKLGQSGYWGRELPRQMLASVGWYGFWTYYWYTGDKQTIVDVYPAVRDYLSLWKLGDDGLVIHRPGDWDWTDWGEQKDVAVLENCWVYLALKAGVAMAKLTGNDSDIADYQRRMQSIEANFNKTFWQGDKYRDPKYKGQTDDRANAMAVIAGLAKPAYYPAIKQVLKTQQYASPYMEKYVLEALYMMDAPAQAIDRMKTRYAEQIDDARTTLWEGWGIGDKGYGGGTYNHGWSGGALTSLSQYAAGIAPTSPAFATYHVLPQPGSLKKMHSVVDTPCGLIDMTFKREAAQTSITLVSPAKTVATVGVPRDRAVKTITINGKVAWAGGAVKALPEGVRYVGADEQWIRFEVIHGEWKLTASE